MMKRTYETPSVELVKFHYSDQVVAVSPDGGDDTYSMDSRGMSCSVIKQVFEYLGLSCSTFPINI